MPSRALKTLYSMFSGITLRWIGISLAVGVFSGLAAVFFFTGVEFLKFVFIHKFAGLTLPAPAGEEIFHGVAGAYRPWLIPIMTTAVGLLTGWLVARYIPGSVGNGTDGTDSMIRAFHHGEGKIPFKVGLIKGLTAILTIATGGSAGREGPISQMGATIGSFISDRFHLTTKERRILLLAGAAGGLGAIFRAPLGGALTAIEVIYKEDFESEAVLPAVISSVIAYSLFSLFFGTTPIFGIPTFQFTNALELPFYVLLAFFCSFVGWFYIRTFEFIKFNVFEKINLKVGLIWTLGLGGLCMGLLGMAFPQLLTGGYGWLELAIKGELAISIMFAILIGKTLATAVTIGSGMSGGMFAPALFVGGMSGGLVGAIAHKYFPATVTQPGGYVLVGMAAFFAGVANAPIGPMIMVCELTQGYGLLAPLMLASVVCIVLGKKTSLYENQVENKFESPAHIEDMTINVLENLSVKDFYRPGRVTTLEEGTTLKALTDIIVGTNELYFPIKNHEGEITGILGMKDVRQVLYETCLFDLIVVRELAGKPVTLVPTDDLYTALMKFVDTNYGQIPVVHPKEPNTILGLLNREDVFGAYKNAISAIPK
ncbi:chloride channel protein [Desulfobaculum bizertense]|uniref:Chloride channel protein, CIC family n=1 Tax=Desulfobaculum bizertense DSM 18034 TaxID=1121442 RepID=A0A1T4WCK8_9BACT|nr:chloride channel protein [Desulfobaculum bizertense]UIJ37408.1 chloride channel protein [Desulfobaculum bizertense]SKA75036.1 chloride channel protein, CIC family [Desulfobaculum bizertense DSM 18034]